MLSTAIVRKPLASPSGPACQWQREPPRRESQTSPVPLLSRASGLRAVRTTAGTDLPGCNLPVITLQSVMVRGGHATVACRPGIGPADSRPDSRGAPPSKRQIERRGGYRVYVIIGRAAALRDGRLETTLVRASEKHTSWRFRPYRKTYHRPIPAACAVRANTDDAAGPVPTGSSPCPESARRSQPPLDCMEGTADTRTQLLGHLIDNTA